MQEKHTLARRSLSLLLALTMVLSMGFISVFAKDTDVVVINDEALRKAIFNELGRTYSEGAALTEGDMLGLTKLVAEDAGITDLTGLEKAVNLETLNLSGNDLSAALKNNAAVIKNFQLYALKSMDMSGCNIDDAIYRCFRMFFAGRVNSQRGAL